MIADMKNIDKVKLGERLLNYFKKQGCEVQVIKQKFNSYSTYEVPSINVFKLSPRECKPGVFQTLETIWQYTSYVTNSSWEMFMKDIVNEHCRNFTSDELITAHSPEELDIKLSIQGF